MTVRKIGKKERWTKRCTTPGCGGPSSPNYVPDEYEICDDCFMAQFKFTTTYDALDHLCITELIPADEVLRVLRIIKDGVFVTHGK